jgi:hypothetical protein
MKKCFQNLIETITHGLEPIALIIRADHDEPGIHFFTPGSFSQQVAYIPSAALRRSHPPLRRRPLIRNAGRNIHDRSETRAIRRERRQDPVRRGLPMIPVNEPLIGAKEIEYVNECLRTGWISSAGRFIEEFEEKWVAYCGMKYGIAMSNGTTALQWPVDMALGVSRSTCGTAGT